MQIQLSASLIIDTHKSMALPEAGPRNKPDAE
jgi:hypothetical protein